MEERLGNYLPLHTNKNRARKSYLCKNGVKKLCNSSKKTTGASRSDQSDQIHHCIKINKVNSGILEGRWLMRIMFSRHPKATLMASMMTIMMLSTTDVEKMDTEQMSFCLNQGHLCAIAFTNHDNQHERR